MLAPLHAYLIVLMPVFGWRVGTAQTPMHQFWGPIRSFAA